MGAKCFQVCSMVFMFCALGVYLAAFAGTAWLTGQKHDYGLWRMCETNTTGSERCHHLALASQKDYFEASRTLATLALACCGFCIIACFLEETEEDTACKRKCYRHIFCLSALITVGLQICAMAVMAAHYKHDPTFMGISAKPSWCFTLSGVSTALAFLSCLCRYRYVSMEHKGPCCMQDCEEHTAKTAPLELPDLNISEVSSATATGAAPVDNGRNRFSSSMVRRTVSASSDGIEGRITKLPPLPLNARAGGLARTSSMKSTDSGVDSKDISRDSLLDEATGPLPLSMEMLKRHDRRLNGATGRRDDRRLRPAFSSTTSLSTTDSQSSAELAPRVHTPINKKRVHYDDIPKESPHPGFPHPSDVPPPATYQQGGAEGEGMAPPIISFPIKTYGVELSRASTNARTTATIDNVRVMSSALKKWKGATAETIPEETSRDSATPEEGAEAARSSTRKKKQKRDRKSKKKKSERQ